MPARIRPLILGALPILSLAVVAGMIVTACDRPPQAATAPATTPTDNARPTPAPPAASGPVYAIFRQSAGDIRVRLATAEAPRTSLAFILLAEHGYFNGRPWSDYSPVVRQTGDTTPVFTVPREFSPKLLHDVGGNLCVSNTSESADARAKPNRIFLTVKPQDRWNLVYAVFGRVESGLDIATGMRDGEKIDSIVIEGDTKALRARFAKEVAEWTKAIEGLRPAASVR